MTLLLLFACHSDCLGDACDETPEIPWDPGDGDSASSDSGDSGADSGGADSDEPVDTDRTIVAVRDCDVTVSVTPDEGVETVQIAGEFDAWAPEDLSGPDAEGEWTVNLGPLDPGEYGYKLLFDGEWEGEPPSTVYSKWVGDSENRNLRVGDCTLPLLQTVSAEATAAGRLTATIQVALAADGAPLDTVTVTVGGQEVTAEVDHESGLIELDVTGLSPGKQSVRIWATDTEGREAENSPLWIPIWVEDEAFDWGDGLMYFVFVDRFRNGDWDAEEPLFEPESGIAECANWNGGDYLGVIHAIEAGYFEELGVRTLWLSPAYENPEGSFLGTDNTHWFTGYHGYWPTDATGIEARYGDVDASAEDRLKELIDTAHAHGIRVLFDLVMNHVHEDHTYVAEHPDWFGGGCVCGSSGCDWDTYARTCWFTDYLPDLDYRNHEVVERVTDDTLALLQAYDVDAVRVDAAKHMDHVAMRTLSMRLRDEVSAGGGADFYLVGETFTSDAGLIMDYVGPGELDAQFDFPLYYAVRTAFVDDGSLRDLESTVSGLSSVYGDAPMSPFIGNHDVERFATAVTGQSGDCWTDSLDEPMTAGGDTSDLVARQSMALAFALTQPGVPLLYYGDEIGLAGGSDPDNRRPMSFAPYLSSAQDTLLGRVQAIGMARAESEALRRGELVQLWVDDDLMVYARTTADDVAIVALNTGSSRAESVSVSSLGLGDATLRDATQASRTATVSGGTLSLSLGSWDYAILVPE